MKQVTKPLWIVLLAVLGTGAAWAGTNAWTSIGPEGGTIQSLVIDPQNSGTVYGVAGGGIFKSTDGTANWRRVYPAATSDGTANYPAFVLAMDPQNTNTLYAGTGGGVFKSTDGGAAWSAASSGLPTLPNGAYRTPRALAVDPRNPGVAYVGFGPCFAPAGNFPPGQCTSGGVFKTTDGGASWNVANSGLPNYGVTALLIDPQNTNTIYAGTLATLTLAAPPTSDGGKGIPISNDGGIFKSTDGAATWTAVNSGLPRSFWYDRPTEYKPINALAIDPQDTSTLYAATGGGGISRTTNGGVTWTGGQISLYVNAVAIDPQDPGTIYAGTANFGLLKSTDWGASFNNVTSGLSADAGTPANAASPVTVSFLAMDRQNPSTLYAGSRFNQNGLTALGGTFKSTDGAESWSPLNTSGLVATNIRSLAVGAENAGTLYVMTAEGRVTRTTDRGTHWNEVYSAPPTDDGRAVYPASALAVDPQLPGIIYVGIGDNSHGGGGVFKSEDSGASWVRFPLPKRGPVRGLAIDPQNTSTIYALTSNNVSSGLFKSSDGAASWSELTSVAPFRGVSSLWIDPQNPGTLFARTGAGTLVKSTNGGASWSGVSPTLPSFSGEDFQAVTVTVNSLAIDPQNSNTIYAISAHDGVFKSTDGAASWSAVNLGLPTGPAGMVSVFSLLFDPQNSSKLYATTSSGVFKSTDGGASSTAVNSGAIMLSGIILAIDPRNTNTVYAGTAGGGVFAITFVAGP